MLSEEQKLFKRDGAVVLRGLFKDWIDVLQDGIQTNEQNPGQWFRDYTPNESKGRFWADYCNWQNNPAFEQFIKQSPAAEIAKTLMQSAQARMFHEHVLVKEIGRAHV